MRPEQVTSLPRGASKGSLTVQYSHDWLVYILRCADTSFYVVVTQDLDRRLAEHNAGRGASFTAARRPVALAYSEAMENRASAESRERQLKHWSRAKKVALIDGDMDRLRKLARRRAKPSPTSA